MTYQALNTFIIIMFVLAAALLIAGVASYFFLNIRRIKDDLSGKTVALAVETMREKKRIRRRVDLSAFGSFDTETGLKDTRSKSTVQKVDIANEDAALHEVPDVNVVPAATSILSETTGLIEDTTGATTALVDEIAVEGTAMLVDEVAAEEATHLSNPEER